MSLYPSLEDMQVHKMMQAQQNAMPSQTSAPQAPSAYPQMSRPGVVYEGVPTASAPELYPGLNEFMGLELNSDMIALHMPQCMQTNETAVTSYAGSMVAPLSNQTAGLRRAQVTNGIREVTVCKGTDKKVGLRVRDINNGIFITLVCKNSPAALVG